LTENEVNAATIAEVVMAGLVPAIHVLTKNQQEDVDARDKRGHDENYLTSSLLSWG
jgi:hypothetical protein